MATVTRSQVFKALALPMILTAMMAALLAWEMFRQGLLGQSDDGPAGASAIELNPSTAVPYDVPAFSFIDQTGRQVTNQETKGKVWVAAFIINGCVDICPIITAEMAEVQKTLPPQRTLLVSFCADEYPATSDLLKSYAREYGADGKQWLLLSGAEPAMFQTAVGMHVIPAGTKNEGWISPSPRLLLIDDHGCVIRTVINFHP